MLAILIVAAVLMFAFAPYLADGYIEYRRS
jgi:hypothetical protein